MPAPDVVVNAADQFASIERGDEAALEQMFDATSRYGGSDHERRRKARALRVCIVIKLNADALISRIDEYFDPAATAPLMTWPATDEAQMTTASDDAERSDEEERRR